MVVDMQLRSEYLDFDIKRPVKADMPLNEFKQTQQLRCGFKFFKFLCESALPTERWNSPLLP